jgi:branched-chain amino acid transport system ATP-binding protein
MENLEMGAFIRKDKQGIKQDFESIFSRFPRLLERKNQIAGTLSGGEQQMLAIGRALMLRPKLILLDEPFTGVDPIAVADIQDIIRKLRDKGMGVLITDHSVRETLAITDRAYIMYSGEILTSGSSDEIANDENARRFYFGDNFAI